MGTGFQPGQGMTSFKSLSLFVHRFVVNMKSKTCSCNLWELVGIHYRHAIAAMSYRGDNPVDYVHGYYTGETYELCYNHTISPINGQEMVASSRVWGNISPPHIRGDLGHPRNCEEERSMRILMLLNWRGKILPTDALGVISMDTIVEVEEVRLSILLLRLER